ncbi:hypothetical protein AAG906_014243 [Vitis piasezkii]
MGNSRAGCALQPEEDNNFIISDCSQIYITFMFIASFFVFLMHLYKRLSFAWDSRVFKLCIGKEVTFRVDYTVPSIGREFGPWRQYKSGFVQVRETGQQKGEVSPVLAELLSLEELSNNTPGASELSIRNLPPSAIGDPSIVEQVRDGSTIQSLLPEFQFVQVFVAGIQSCSRVIVETELASDEPNGEGSAETRLVAPEPFGKAKHFTEIRVRIVLEGVDKFGNLIGSVYYPDGESAKDLALELVESGLAKYLEWSASMMEEDKNRLRFWTNYVPHPQIQGIRPEFYWKSGSPLAERRVNLSSIRCPKWATRDERPASRPKVLADGPTTASADSRVMDFGSVFLHAGVNVAELVVARGFGTVIRHRDFEERSNYYDALLLLNRLFLGEKESILQRILQVRRMPAIVEYVLSGHRFKLLIPKETCSIAFSLSLVFDVLVVMSLFRQAIALMRRKIMQRDIEVETVDRTGTFLGSLWEAKTNMAVTLLEAGLAKLQTSFGSDRIPDAHLLAQAEQSAKKEKLKIWENYVEGEEVSNGSATESKQKEVLKVVVTEILGGGRFYVQTIGDQRVASIQQQLASLNLQEAPVIGAFNPKKGDIVLAQFSADNSWNRAMIVNAPRGAVESPKDKFEVFYIDYGNQEIVPYSQLRPLDPSVSSAPGLAQLCSLAYIKVPSLDEDFGQEAAEYFSDMTLNSSKELRAVIEDKDTSGGKVKGQGTGTVLIVTLIDVEAESSINAAMLKEGLATVEKRKRWDPKEKQIAFDNLEKFQAEARLNRLRMWQYGDIQSDDEDTAPPVRKAGGRRLIKASTS